MLKAQFPFHFFHAHGCAFGAEFTKPFCATIGSHAATSISSVGGHAVAHEGPLNFRELVRIEAASTQIAAIEETLEVVDAAGKTERYQSYDTVVTCRLEGVNIFNQFTAERIVAHLSAKTIVTGSGLGFKSDTTFTTIGTRFEGLRVGGVVVTPTLVHEQKGSDRIKLPIFGYGGRDTKEGLEVTPDSSKPAYLTTLVEGLGMEAGDEKLVLPRNNTLYVPDFGVIYLAEYLITPNARQLNMFRIQFGCGVDGRSSGGGVGANGTSCPPPP